MPPGRPRSRPGGTRLVDDYPDAHTIPGLVVYRYDAPLFFANAQDFRRRALAAADQQAPVRWFVLNVEANVEVDFTALEALDSVREEIVSRGGVFALARVRVSTVPAHLVGDGSARAPGHLKN